MGSVGEQPLQITTQDAVGVLMHDLKSTDLPKGEGKLHLPGVILDSNLEVQVEQVTSEKCGVVDILWHKIQFLIAKLFSYFPSFQGSIDPEQVTQSILKVSKRGNFQEAIATIPSDGAFSSHDILRNNLKSFEARLTSDNSARPQEQKERIHNLFAEIYQNIDRQTPPTPQSEPAPAPVAAPAQPRSGVSAYEMAVREGRRELETIAQERSEVGQYLLNKGITADLIGQNGMDEMPLYKGGYIPACFQPRSLLTTIDTHFAEKFNDALVNFMIACNFNTLSTRTKEIKEKLKIPNNRLITGTDLKRYKNQIGQLLNEQPRQAQVPQRPAVTPRSTFDDLVQPSMHAPPRPIQVVEVAPSDSEDEEEPFSPASAVDSLKAFVFGGIESIVSDDEGALDEGDKEPVSPIDAVSEVLSEDLEAVSETLDVAQPAVSKRCERAAEKASVYKAAAKEKVAALRGRMSDWLNR
ncbi:MAG: hypothetical protein S4CHLAM102_06210 [Chlamydiia bacterium]|nr:hypothetical protein [Chlamydiia bacterium]